MCKPTTTLINLNEYIILFHTLINSPESLIMLTSWLAGVKRISWASPSSSQQQTPRQWGSPTDSRGGGEYTRTPGAAGEFTQTPGSPGSTYRLQGRPGSTYRLQGAAGEVHPDYRAIGEYSKQIPALLGVLKMVSRVSWSTQNRLQGGWKHTERTPVQLGALRADFSWQITELHAILGSTSYPHV